jgi:hypothetical protein
MADPEFTDENVIKYVNGLELDELKKFVSDLDTDFEEALNRRFRVSPNQMDTLRETPAFFKANITSALEDLLRIRSEKAEAHFSVSGLDYGSATGQSMEQSDVEIEVTHEPDCTWTASVIITK